MNHRLADGFGSGAEDGSHEKIAFPPEQAAQRATGTACPRPIGETLAAARFLLARGDVRGPKIGTGDFCMDGALSLVSVRESDCSAPPLSATGATWIRSSASSPCTARFSVFTVNSTRRCRRARWNISALRSLLQASRSSCAATPVHRTPSSTTRASYRPETATDARRRVLAFLRRYLVGDRPSDRSFALGQAIDRLGASSGCRDDA